MADYSASTTPSGSSAIPHSRPTMKRVRHTWHGETTYTSHFEDFMREIGVDARQHHLCCLPRQATATMYTRVRSKSVSFVSFAARDGALFASPVQLVDESSHKKLSGPSKNSGPSTSKSTSVNLLARPSVASSSKATAPVVKLKAQAATSVDMQSHGASSQYPSVPALRGLRFLMGDSIAVKSSRKTSANSVPADQELWRPLPNAPALVPATESPVESAPTASSTRSLSRVPSFASLETVSSSEGPETPRGQSPPPLPAQVHELSPTLSYLEHVSKIRVPALCVTCHKAGHNFPSCPACGDTWCSRECRVKGSRGKRHVCKRVVDAPTIRADGRGRHIA